MDETVLQDGSGRFMPDCIHHGVYALVPQALLSLDGLRMAAVLAFGDGGALSHPSAGALLGLIKAEAGPLEVSVSSRAGRPQRPGLRIHRTATLRPEDISAVDGIPCTTVARTLIEERFLGLIRGAGLPKPEVQGYLDLRDWDPMIQPDFLWRAHKVIVETDGWQHHGTRLSFEGDRRRDQRAMTAGFRTLRVTWLQIGAEPARLQRAVASAVSAGAEAAAAAAWTA